MSNLDALVSRFRRWTEDHLPWYDREQEQAAQQRTERLAKRSSDARIRAQAVQSEQRFRRE